ncbi:MAG TPA: DUF72 domain-containing protein [Lacunisphaera sp.]|jgi:uncharacterized protein YecE (DUF72 family)
MAMIRIGISGWTYPPWRGVFFPPKLAHRKELAFAASQVSSIEINGTFYSLQRPASYAKWYNETPEKFVFSVKAPRYITHIRRLKDCAIPLANFFASGVLRLEGKLGPILWQLSPSFHFDAVRLEIFLALLPKNTIAAGKLALRHDDKIRSVSIKSTHRPLRHALEVRHVSFCTPEFVRLLRKYSVAVVVADTAGKWPLIEDVTADFVYVRLHGDEELYASGYSTKALAGWEKKSAHGVAGEIPRERSCWISPPQRGPGGVTFLCISTTT